jgi:hypothetical protein
MESTKLNQQRYRTPFLPEGEQRDLIKYISDRSVSEKIPVKDVITYEESDVHFQDEIDKAYKGLSPETVKKFPYGLFLLGMRMTYNKNRAPDNVVMQAGNNQHLIGVFSDTKDFVNVFKTFMTNMNNWQNNKTRPFINSQQSELHYVCELDKVVDQRMQAWSNEKKTVGELYEVYNSLYKQRVQNDDKDSPLYIFCLGWDKAETFGINRNMSTFSKWVNLLQLCGEYNMHFIFLCTSVGELPTSFFQIFTHRLCGTADEKSSMYSLESVVASKVSEGMKNGYMYIKDKNLYRRMKIYQSPEGSLREIAEKELVL